MAVHHPPIIVARASLVSVPDGMFHTTQSLTIYNRVVQVSGLNGFNNGRACWIGTRRQRTAAHIFLLQPILVFCLGDLEHLLSLPKQSDAGEVDLHGYQTTHLSSFHVAT